MKLKKKRHLFRDSAKWRLLSYYVFFLMRLFYRRITVEGKENIPAHGPVIFAPNHQNALMDPLAILYAARRQTVFLARADIFKIPLLRNLFFWLKIIPVFRIRDGKENLGNNEASFNVAVEVLENKRSVCIFPEAAHTNLRSLLPLRKGIPRLAFMAEEKNNFKLGLNVVPAGIYFDNYEHMRSVLHVRFGKPIAVYQFEAEYWQNPQKAMLTFRDKLTDKLSALALNIKTREYYDVFYSLSHIFSEPMITNELKIKSRQEQRFRKQKEMVAAFEDKLSKDPEYMLEFRNNGLRFLRSLKTHGIKWEFFRLPSHGFFRLLFGWLLMLITWPVFLYGLVNNILFYGSVRLLVKKIKDHQFHSSIKFVWGLAVSPFFYIFQSIVVYAISGSLVFGVVYLVLLPVTGFLARVWAGKFIELLQQLKLYWLKSTGNQSFNEIIKDWNLIKTQIQSICQPDYQTRVRH